MVIFCDPEFEQQLRERRPKHLLPKTRFYPISFEDMPLTKYRSDIIKNRKEKVYYFDERNTASYYLLCMARYGAIQRVIDENPFNSTHFAWINICIERMGVKNLQQLDSCLDLYRDKFSSCHIDYIDKTLLLNESEYWLYGRCSMCSGFFTGNKEYMYKFCTLIQEKFFHYLKKGLQLLN